MSSLQTRLAALITAIGADIKSLQPQSWTTLSLAGGGSTSTGCLGPAVRLETNDVVRFRGVYHGATYVGGTCINGVFTPPATPLVNLAAGFRPTGGRRVIQGAASSALADLVTVVETNGDVWLTGDLDASAFYSLDGASFTK